MMLLSLRRNAFKTIEFKIMLRLALELNSLVRVSRRVEQLVSFAS